MHEAIVTDLSRLQRETQAQEEENTRFRAFVLLDVALPDRQLNDVVQTTTRQVWEHIDCRTCANCCRMRYPTFTRVEVQRIATYLGLTTEEVRARYLTSDKETGRYRTRELPCPFLHDNLCTIYDVRPGVCAGYPHLQRNFRSRLWQAIDNAEVCPIVYNVIAHLRKQLGFTAHASEGRGGDEERG